MLNTPKRRYYSSSASHRHHRCHHYHPSKRNDRGYFPYEFKKGNTPTFFGEMNKPQDAEAWLLIMRKFFRLHYSENMKARITLFSLKSKAEIWWKM